MKTIVLIFIMVLTMGLHAQVVMTEFRYVPEDKMEEFEHMEKEYWSKVAKAGIDNGNLLGWGLYRRVGFVPKGEANYVFRNIFESLDKLKPELVWNNESIKAAGVDLSYASTWEISKTTAVYYSQIEDMAGDASNVVVVNYAKPDDLEGFVNENKELWKPVHEKNIEQGFMNMANWGLETITYPKGHDTPFSVFTWDGFNNLTDALKWMAYSDSGSMPASFQSVLKKSKMGEYMPEGFVESVIYEKVMNISPDN